MIAEYNANNNPKIIAQALLDASVLLSLCRATQSPAEMLHHLRNAHPRSIHDDGLRQSPAAAPALAVHQPRREPGFALRGWRASTAIPLFRYSSSRLSVRASRSAVRKILTGASGKTTVVISRPSATILPSSPSCSLTAGQVVSDAFELRNSRSLLGHLRLAQFLSPIACPGKRCSERRCRWQNEAA